MAGDVVEKEAYDNLVAWMSMNAPYHHMVTFKARLAELEAGHAGGGVVDRDRVCEHGIRWPWACDDCDRAALAPTPPATPVQPTASVEAVDEIAKRAADAIGVTPYSDMRPFVEQAVKYALAALTPAPTQGDGLGSAANVLASMAGGKPEDYADMITPSPALVSAPAPAGEVREALEALVALKKGILADVSSAHSNRGNGASEWMREDDRDFRKELRAAFDQADAALSSPPEPSDSQNQCGFPFCSCAKKGVCAHAEPVSAPATDGEVVDALRWVDTNMRSAKHAMKTSVDCGDLRANFAAHDAYKHLKVIRAALSNPAPGHGEAVPVAWRMRCINPKLARQPNPHWVLLTKQPPCPPGYEVEALGVIAHPATGEKPAPATGEE